MILILHSGRQDDATAAGGLAGTSWLSLRLSRLSREVTRGRHGAAGGLRHSAGRQTRRLRHRSSPGLPLRLDLDLVVDLSLHLRGPVHI